jgi:selenide, water dikinase
VLSGLPVSADANLLVGHGTFDDAGVYRLSDELALVQSVDFFTPVVDDPYDFGRIAAANALSDIYAMGARPLTALAVCAFPRESLPLQILRETLRGGLSVLDQDGVVMLGGHTVKGPEFTYGLSVTGRVHPDEILTNAGARVGDELVLTKPIGTGVLSTALKRGLLAEEERAALVESMARTNRTAADLCRTVDVHALTDVTGYGLLGHGLEMAEASRVAIEIDAGAVPLLPRARWAVETGAVPGGLLANRAWVADRLQVEDVDDELLSLLCDPQTSGGLRAAVAPGDGERLVTACREHGLIASRIGRATGGPAGRCLVCA